MKKRLLAAICMIVCALILFAACDDANENDYVRLTTPDSTSVTPTITKTPETPTPTETFATPTPTETPVMPTPTETPVTPTPTETPITPTPTETPVTPTPTETPVTPTLTETPITPTSTETPATPTPTETPVTPTPTETPVTPTPTETPITPTLTESPVTPTPTETPVTPTPTETPVTPTPEPPFTIDRMQVEEVSGSLYKLKGSGAESVQAGILYGRYLVTLNNESDGMKVVSRDLISGVRVVLYDAQAFNYGSLKKLDRGGFIFTDIDGFCAYFEDALDAAPEILREAIVPGDGTGEEEWINCNYLPDGRRTVLRGGALTVENLFGGETFTVTIPSEYSYISLIGVFDGKLGYYAPVYGDYTVTYFLTLDENGVFEEVGQCGGNEFSHSGSGELVRSGFTGEMEIVSFPRLETLAHVCFLGSSEYYCYSDGKYVVAGDSSGSDTVLGVYGYDGLMYFNAPTPFGFSSVLDSQDDFILVRSSAPYNGEEYNEMSDTICIIDLSAAVGEPLPDFGELADKKIREIEEKYPVIILAGDDALIEFPGFIAAAMGNRHKQLDALGILAQVLDDFPAGFFDELFADDDAWPINGLTVCLTGNLRPTDDYSTSYPSAYAYTNGDMQYIVANIGYSSGLRSTFAHELMHAVDFRLSYISSYSVYPDWFYYVPDGSYNYGYRDENGNDYFNYTYTVYDEGREWFVDYYSKTFPIEDRARLFENLFCFDENGCWFYPYGRILDRMAYMVRVIRENFVSVQTSVDIPIWEKALEKARELHGG